MDSNKRACLAFIISRAVNQDYRSVYDFGAGRLCMFTSSGSVDNTMYLTSNATVLLLVLWQTCMIWVRNHLPQLI